MHVQGILAYRGYGNCECHCLYDVYKNDNGITIVITESPDNSGTSVTNMIETITKMIYKRMKGSIIPENCNPYDIFWIEHYPSAVLREEETYDKVDLDWEGGNFVRPRWKRMQYSEVRNRIA